MMSCSFVHGEQGMAHLRRRKPPPKRIFLFYGKLIANDTSTILHNDLEDLHVYVVLEIDSQKYDVTVTPGIWGFMNRLGQLRSLRNLALMCQTSSKFLGAIRSSWILPRCLRVLSLKGILTNEIARRLSKLLTIFSGLKQLIVEFSGTRPYFIASTQISFLCANSHLESYATSNSQDTRLFPAVFHCRRQLNLDIQLSKLKLIRPEDFKLTPSLIREILKQRDLRKVIRWRKSGCFCENCRSPSSNPPLDVFLRDIALGCDFQQDRYKFERSRLR